LRLAAVLPGYDRKNISVREALCDSARVISRNRKESIEIWLTRKKMNSKN